MQEQYVKMLCQLPPLVASCIRGSSVYKEGVQHTQHTPNTPIVFGTERLTDVMTEYGMFVYEYWHGSPENTGLEPLDFNWDVYRELDKDRVLHLTVGRDGDKMIAAALYIVMMDIKRKRKKIATCDTFAVSRDYRGYGLGRVLYATVETALIARSVNEIQNGYREVYNVEPLFPKLGFYAEHRMYVKKVG